MEKRVLKKGVVLLFLACFSTLSAHAQLSNLINKVTSSVKSATSTTTASSLAGTWKYTSPAVQLSSSNVISNLGGKVVDAKIEETLGQALQKTGVTAGKLVLTLSTDNKFTAKVVGGKQTTGTYVYKDNTLTLTFATGTAVKTTAKMEGKNLQLLMDGDILLSFLQSISVAAATKDASFKTVSSLLKSYTSMKVGLTFAK